MDWMPQAIREGIFTIIFISGPLVVLAATLGLSVGIVQAATQIQEQTLPQTVKIFVIGFVILSFGASLASPLFNMSDRIFSTFPQLIR